MWLRVFERMYEGEVRGYLFRGRGLKEDIRGVICVRREIGE